MNHRAMMKHFLAVLVISLLAACAPDPTERPLHGANIGGDFALTDSKGKTVHWADFAGQYRIVYFGYTFCPDVCPTDVAVTVKALAQFTKDEPLRGKQVRPIFITIDPARDGPKQLGEFAAHFPRLVALTGTQAQIDAAKKAFKVYAAKGLESSGGYLMDHSRIAYLFDPEGKPIATLPVDRGADAVAAELATWVW